MPGQTGPKLKTRTAVEEVLALVGKYDRRGYTTREIALELRTRHAIDLSHVAVAARLIQLRESYKLRQDEDRAASVAEKLLQYAEIRREAWAAWDRSKEDAEKNVTELVAPLPPKDDGEGNGAKPAKTGKRRGGRFASATDPGVMAETLRRLKVIETREGRLPANAYLNTIMDTLAAERELLGLDAPTKTDVRAAVVSVDAGQVVGFDALAEAEPVEAEIERVRALPAAKEQGPA